MLAELEQASSSICFVSWFMDLHNITFLLFTTNKESFIVYIYSNFPPPLKCCENPSWDLTLKSECYVKHLWADRTPCLMNVNFIKRRCTFNRTRTVRLLNSLRMV